MFFQKDIETMNRRDLEALQLERLKHIVDYCYNNVPFYHERLRQAGVTGDKIKTLSDVQYIPCTTKDDIRDNYPFQMLAQPMKKIVRIHASSGTTGKPTVGVYTRRDIENWSDQVARVAVGGGATEGDTHPDRLWLRPVHRRLGPALRLGKAGSYGDSGLLGQYGQAADDVPGIWRYRLVATPSYALYLGGGHEGSGLSYGAV